MDRKAVAECLTFRTLLKGAVMKRAIFIIFIMLFSEQAVAAETQMPITATIIVCPRDNLQRACAQESRCCYLLEDKDETVKASPSGGESAADLLPVRLSYAGSRSYRTTSH